MIWNIAPSFSVLIAFERRLLLGIFLPRIRKFYFSTVRFSVLILLKHFMFRVLSFTSFFYCLLFNFSVILLYFFIMFYISSTFLLSSKAFLSYCYFRSRCVRLLVSLQVMSFAFNENFTFHKFFVLVTSN